MKKKEGKHCAFCGRDEQKTPMVAQGVAEALICVECVLQLAQHINKLSEKDTEEDSSAALDFTHTPRMIKRFLDDYVIGQDRAKEVLAIAVYNHYKRIEAEKYGAELSEDLKAVEVEKSNVLLVGPSGTGKTLLAKSMARLLNVPFAVADATVFTEAGYVGEDVESILSRLLQACNYRVPLAEKGIVYIDEIDKLARKSSDNPSISKDVGGEGVQQGLLKLLEGSEVLVPPQGGRKHPDQKMVKINTQHILFICGGAFEGIEKVIMRRLNTRAIGFQTKEKQSFGESTLMRYVNAQDLRQYGIIPELLGRLPLITYLEPLDAQSLRDILLKPKNAIIRQFRKLFAIDNIVLDVREEAIEAIVAQALRLSLGARGLRSICENVFHKAFFSIEKGQSRHLIIGKEEVEALEGRAV